MNSPMTTETASTFQFRRYREEVALRASLKQGTNSENKPKASTDVPTNHANTARSSPDSENDSGDGTVIQNLSKVTAVIGADGKVLTEEKSSSDNSIPIKNDETDQREHICVVPEGTTLLLRNLRGCHITIHLPLPAVHFVGIENTEIVFYNRSKDGINTSDNNQETDAALLEKAANTHANTTIHMTDCRGMCKLQLETSAQQLRIHRAIGLVVEMMNPPVANNRHTCDWKPGSIILEASKGVLFSVPPLATPEQQVSSTTTVATTKTHWHQVIVKDFQWLRKGIASPNFQIEVKEARKSESTRDTNSTDNSDETLETRKGTELALGCEKSEDETSSDSEDEL